MSNLDPKTKKKYRHQRVQNPYISNHTTYLHNLIENNQLHLAEEALFTKENLIKRNGRGQNIIQKALEKGCLNQLPIKSIEGITKKVLLMIDENGQNCFHTAAKYGNLAQIPKKFLTTENLEITNDFMETPHHILAKNGGLGELDSLQEGGIKITSLLKKDPKGFNCFHIAIEKKQLDPYLISRLTKAILLEETKQKENLLHLCAKHGALSKIPKEMITAEAMHTKDKYERTPIYTAAIYGFMDQINPKLVTKESLTTKDNLNRIALHHLSSKELKKYLKLFNEEELKTLAENKSLKTECIKQELKEREIIRKVKNGRDEQEINI
jgi:ankyrin repeat protein